MSFKFTGLNELLEFVQKLEIGMQAQLLNVAGETLVSLTRERFSLGKDPYDVAWKPSARALAQGGQTLRDKGLLMNSFTWQPIGHDALVYGTNIPYAPAHQFGAHITAKKKVLRFGVNGKVVYAKSVTIPKRVMMPDERGDPPGYDLELQASLEAVLNAIVVANGGNP